MSCRSTFVRATDLVLPQVDVSPVRADLPQPLAGLLVQGRGGAHVRVVRYQKALVELLEVAFRKCNVPWGVRGKGKGNTVDLSVRLRIAAFSTYTMMSKRMLYVFGLVPPVAFGHSWTQQNIILCSTKKKTGIIAAIAARRGSWTRCERPRNTPKTTAIPSVTKSVLDFQNAHESQHESTVTMTRLRPTNQIMPTTALSNMIGTAHSDSRQHLHLPSLNKPSS